LLAESLLLSIAGGLLGLALGYVGVRALLAINPGDVPRIGEHGSAVTLDWRVLAFTAGVSIITSILFGLIPALSASRIDLSAAIQEGASRSGSSVRQNKARSLLVVTEVALALILLIGAALLIRTLVALRSVDPGIDARSVLTCEMSLSGKRFERTAGIAQMVRDVEQRVGSLPGVIAVASSWSLPLELAFSDSFIIDGRPLANGPVHGVASMRPVSPQFFGVFRIPLLRGRLFTERDDDAASGVVLISQAMAKKFWPAGDPLPDRLSIDKYIGPEFAAPPRRIVGIVGDARDRGLNATRTDDVYSTGAGSRWNDRARRAHSSSYLGDSHEDRALLTQRGDPEGTARIERWTPGFAHSVHGARGRAIDCAHRFQYRSAGSVRGHCAGTGGHRYSRSDGLFGPAVHAGDGCSDGAWGHAGTATQHGGVPGHAAGAERRGVGSRSLARALARDGEPHLRSERLGPDRVLSSLPATDRCSSGGDLYSFAPGDEN
jgi:hypothetical protein